jgi:hypothetical protein
MPPVLELGEGDQFGQTACVRRKLQHSSRKARVDYHIHAGLAVLLAGGWDGISEFNRRPAQ